MCVETRLFYPTITQRSCHVLHCTYIPYVAIYYMFNIEEIQAALSTLYSTIKKSILHGKSAYSVRLLYSECALKHGCFIRRYHSDPAMYSTVPTSLTLPSTICSIYKNFKLHYQRYILLLKTLFYIGKVRTVCAYFAHNACWNTDVLSDKITAILPCTALYLHLLLFHLLYVQYRRISSCIINAIFYY